MAEGELCVEASQAFASPLEPRLVGQLSPGPGRLMSVSDGRRLQVLDNDLDHVHGHLGLLDLDDDRGHL